MAVLNTIRSRRFIPGMNRMRYILFMAFALLFFGKPGLRAQPDVSREYQIKAVFLFNFAGFVNWPSDTFSNAQQPLVIGVLGEDPFDDYLDATVRGEKVHGHPLIVRRFNSLQDVKNCQILFISRSEQRRLGEVLAGLKGKNILTVSDIDRFPEDGGMIGFITVQNKIHFKINPVAARNADLTLSSKLLRLAQIVIPQNQ